jgi:hypothetical protein
VHDQEVTVAIDPFHGEGNDNHSVRRALYVPPVRFVQPTREADGNNAPRLTNTFADGVTVRTSAGLVERALGRLKRARDSATESERIAVILADLSELAMSKRRL